VTSRLAAVTPIASAAVPTIHVSEDSFTLPHESHTNWIMEAPQCGSCTEAINNADRRSTTQDQQCEVFAKR